MKKICYPALRDTLRSRTVNFGTFTGAPIYWGEAFIMGKGNHVVIDFAQIV
jgi:hypothetical protein